MARIAPGISRQLSMAGPVVFHSASGKLDLAQRAGIANVSVVADDGNGMSTYAIDLSGAE